MNSSPGSRLWNFELFADGAHRPLLDFTMAWHAGDLPALRIEPDGVRAALPKQEAALLAQVALQLRQFHASENSSVSRTAVGDMCFSASSRWHSKTSLRASRRFAFASSRVSPCEMAAGISSTKQVYPPSRAGSKTAVSFIPLEYHRWWEGDRP